ncbi:hypothetical protein ACJMK2_019291 [Sinanodonta woodiana]
MRSWQYGLQVFVFLLEVIEVLATKEQWTKWSSWTQCSVTCGYGVMKRRRVWETNNDDNQITYEDILECYTEKSCPIDGRWSFWGPWNSCTKYCGGGNRIRYRECNNPTPQFDGKYCEGKNFEDVECNKRECPELPPNFNISQCNDTTFMCYNKLQCVPKHDRCDDSLQCHDGSDEADCDYFFEALNSACTHDRQWSLYVMLLPGLVYIGLYL